jgi:acetyl-CoA synthetase
MNIWENTMLRQADGYEATRAGFRWQIPERYNIAVDVCDRWAASAPDRVAIIDIADDGTATETTFAALSAQSNRLANALAVRGIGRSDGPVGDRVGVLLPQRVETAVAHLAVYKLGAVAIPLFSLFGPDALAHRLRDSGARAIITDATGAAAISAMRDTLPDLEIVLSVDGSGEGTEDFTAACAGESDKFSPVETAAEDPALLIYTSGTTGNPKGALHAHRVLLGHLPGVEMSHNFLPHPDDCFWTPADWAWIGGLLDVLMPALHHGLPVIARRFGKFDPAAAFDLIRDHKIRNAFLPPTALKMMRGVPDPESWGIEMRSVASGGETLGAELIDWGRRAFATTINEFYGQTECNMVVSSCIALEPSRPGIMGRPVPGHDVEVIDGKTGAAMATGDEGMIAVRAPDPVMFLRYWNQPEATKNKFVDGPDGRWLLTGDKGARSADGRLRFIGRDDDVIGSAGYRIGPAEIEDCLIGHPAIRFAGVVGKPDPLRGAVVAAYITLEEGFTASEALVAEIAGFVKTRLAAHEYPRVVRFIDDMPMTTTGKIIRRKLRELAQQEADKETRA